MKTGRALLLLSIATLWAAGLLAEEGMWMPQQVPAMAAKLTAMGFRGDPKAFADLTGQPMGAIVSLGGCTASFVSPDGLIVTNHHCAARALQANSTTSRNLLKDGFLAKTRDEELSNGPGSRVTVTTSMREVASSMTGNIDANATDRQRYDIIEKRRRDLVAACEKGGDRCTVASFYDGLKYFEIRQMEIRDVRLVYAPADGIGVFGGETDNWRWPRQTGDWSFLRAYVGKDGKPAAFSKDNVPFKPKHWLSIAKQGIKPGDLVFVVGYPGRTQRYQTYAQVKATTEFSMPRSIRNAEEQLALIDRLTQQDPERKLRLAGRIQSLNNGLTDNKGMLEGLVKGGSLAKKESQEKQLEAWIAADPARQMKYGDVLPALRALQAESDQTRERDATLTSLAGSCTELSSAQSAYRAAVERAKPEAERDPAFGGRGMGGGRGGQDAAQQTTDVTSDRAFFGWALGLVAALPADQRIPALDQAAGLRAGMSKAEADKAIDAFETKMFAGTRIGDRDFRSSLDTKSVADVLATKDSFILLASELEPLQASIREATQKRSGAQSRLMPLYMEAVLAHAGGLAAPDANGTLRVTYGQVKGVDARDGLYYKPQTTLEGIVEKNTGQGDFIAPPFQLDAIKALRAGKKTPYLDPVLKDVPVNFLSTVDTTGGNSGSPTLNAKGELVGLLFDGTYESVASNYLFDPVSTRSIHVDARYMLWNMMDVDGAGYLVKEMETVQPLHGTPARSTAPSKVAGTK